MRTTDGAALLAGLGLSRAASAEGLSLGAGLGGLTLLGVHINGAGARL